MTHSIAVCIISIICFAASHSFSSKVFSAWQRSEPTQTPGKEAVHSKTRQLSVPVLGGGQVKGYLLVQLGYTREKDADKGAETYIESVILDETLGYLFPKAQAGGGGVDKLDMEQVRKALLERVQGKIPDKKILELRFNEFTFMNRSEAK